MKTIASFTVDHDKLQKGLYVSRVDGDVITYDLRMAVPNSGVYLQNAAMHTFEHLLATCLRNSAYGEQIVYVGPMGCRTGFYLLTRTVLAKSLAIDVVRGALAYIATYQGVVPGTESSRECGNYLEHDLPGAKAMAEDMCHVLVDWTEPMLDYDWHQ